MFAAGLPGPAVPSFALIFAYQLLGMKGFTQSRWRSVAYATRYGKGCTLNDALSLDCKGIGDYIEAIAYCVEQEAKASKVKKR